MYLTSPADPPFVVITITPLEPLAPYGAVADASLSTVMLSISEALTIDKTPMSVKRGLIDPLLTGTPSITNKGALDPEIDPSPLILMS